MESASLHKLLGVANIGTRFQFSSHSGTNHFQNKCLQESGSEFISHGLQILYKNISSVIPDTVISFNCGYLVKVLYPILKHSSEKLQIMYQFSTKNG